MLLCKYMQTPPPLTERSFLTTSNPGKYISLSLTELSIFVSLIASTSILESSKKYTLTMRTSSSDLRIIPDITRSAEDSLLIMAAKLTISSAQLCTDALDRRLLVPTCITIALGFLRKTGLIWSLMSIIVQPGNEETLTFADLEIFRSWRFFKIESPAINTSFLFADLFVGSFLALSGVRVALSVRLLEF